MAEIDGLTTIEAITCSECGALPKKVRLRKSDGKQAMPMKWQRTKDGAILCSKCRYDDPAINLTLGAVGPLDGLALALEQMRFAHRFRNKLCEIERTRREKTDAAIRQHSPELADLELQIADMSQTTADMAGEIKARNAIARRRVATPEDRNRLASLRAELAQHRARRKALRAEIFAGDSREQLLGHIDDGAAIAIKSAYNASPLYWGTKGIVMSACQSMRKGAPPRFLSWSGGKQITDDDMTTNMPRRGHLAIQLQGGQTIADTLQANNLFRLEMTGAHRKNGPTAIAHFRVGANEDGLGAWVRLPVCIHDLPPKTARVKWAHLLLETIGSVPHWSVMLTVQWPEAHTHPNTATSGQVGLNLGWRRLPDGGLRVASWFGSDESKGQLILPKEQVDALEYLDGLRATQDEMFNDYRNRLVEWLQANQHPEWMKVATRSLRSARRLCRAILYWRDHRFPGDDEIFRQMNGERVPNGIRKSKQQYRYVGFRLQWKHLNDMEEGRRKNLRAQRDVMYRMFAAKLSREYATACLDTTKYQKLRRRPGVGEKDEQSDRLRRMASLASVGRLRAFITMSMSSVTSVDSHHITQRCHACGKLQDFDASAVIVNCCRHCNSECDQDENAARNALALGQLTGGSNRASRGPQDDGGE